MCYFLYGAVNEGVNAGDYERVMKNAAFHFRTGKSWNVDACVAKCASDYRITDRQCDCDTAIGGKDSTKQELKDLEALLNSLRSVRGIKYILLSKNWWKETNQKQQTVHISDIDAKQFLAHAEDNCLYKIHLYTKY